MKRRPHLVLSLGLLSLVAGGSYLATLPAAAQKPTEEKPDAAAVERARKTVRMLDEVYKNAVVLITDKYVNKEDDFAAGSAVVQLFKNVSKSGHQQVRLLDVSGDPYEPENVAKDDFEKTGVQKIKEGAALYEEVVKKDNGKYELRAMTNVPVVLDKCILCHAHYADAKKKGQNIGAISYRIPIE
jgi:hypothetical protein